MGFDEHEWQAMSFDFLLYGLRYTKDAGSFNWSIDYVDYEFDYGSIGIPSLITTVLDHAPHAIENYSG